MKSILVSGASGIVGYGILRSLRKSLDPLFLIGTSIYNDSVAPAFCDIFEKAPPTNSSEYLKWLLFLIDKYNIDIIIPGIEADLYFWTDHIYELSSTKAKVLLNNIDLIKICQDKWIFFQKLKKSNISCVIDSSLEKDFQNLKEKYGLPFILKPRRGFASKGFEIINSLEDFEKIDKKIPLMAQPFVGDNKQEYTISAFCDGKGSYFNSITLRRELSNEGFTEKAEVADTEPFINSLNELCNLLHPLGPTNFQFRLCKDGPKLLEINPRISSSTSIRAAFGYNESLMALDFFLNQQSPVQPIIRYGRSVRYIDEKIFYEDSIHI